MAWPYINGLPDLYQVRCPFPTPGDWNQLMSIVEGCESDSTGCGNDYYLFDVCDESWDNYHEPHTDDDGDEIYTVQFETWKELVLRHKNKPKSNELYPSIPGLPDVYQVQCPANLVRGRFNELLSIAANKNEDVAGHGNAYYLIDGKRKEWRLQINEYSGIVVTDFNYWEKCLLAYRDRAPVNEDVAGIYSQYPKGRSVKQLGKKEAIHCTTERLASAICRIFANADLKWFTGCSYEKNTYFNKQEGTYYFPSEGTHCTYQTTASENGANTIYRAEDVIKEYEQGFIGWAPGDSWRHKDDSCGLSIAVHPEMNGHHKGMYFIDFGENGTGYVGVDAINRNVDSGVWLIKKENSIIIKKTKTNQNAKDKEEYIVSKSDRSYTGKSVNIPADQERIKSGQRRKGTAVRG